MRGSSGPIPRAVRRGHHAASLQPTLRIAPATDTIALGRFVRDGRTILLPVNVGSDAYSGQLVTTEPCSWLRLDPSGGRIENPSPQRGRPHAIRLDARQALILISAP